MLCPRPFAWLARLFRSATANSSRHQCRSNCQLRVEMLESRLVPATLVVGADSGGLPEVKVFDSQTSLLPFDFFAFSPGFNGGVRVAAGDVTGDGVSDILAAPGPGGGPEVKVFDGRSGELVRDFFAFVPQLASGLYLAAGDVNHDGFADIIVAPDAKAGPEVKVYSGKNQTLLIDFFAYSPLFAGGVRVAAGDTNGDGFAEIITGPGAGGGPQVNVFDGRSAALLLSFKAYAGTFLGGIYVATGDTNGDGGADILTTPGIGGPLVRIFDASTSALLGEVNAFPAVPPLFSILIPSTVSPPSASQGFSTISPGGWRVATVERNGDGRADVVVVPGPGFLPVVLEFDAQNQTVLDGLFAFNPFFSGGVFVGAGG